MVDEEKVYTKQGILTRNKILNNAEKLFAKKGYDGTSVDEIAEGAKINKATLYHYFKGKKQILKEIIRVNSINYRKDRNNRIEIKNVFNSQGDVNDDVLDFLVDDGLLFMSKYDNLFKIILVESLKENSDLSVFEIFNSILMSLLDDVDSMDMKVLNCNAFISKLFFFNIIPIVFYIALNDSFADFYKINTEELKEYFKTAYKQVYKETLIFQAK